MATADDPDLVAAVRAAVREAVGAGPRILRMEPLPGAGGGAAVLVTLDRGGRLVVKLTAPGGGSGRPPEPPADPGRTATAIASARAAGVPVPEVLAARRARHAGDRGHLVLRHVKGVEWRRLCLSLDGEEVRSVHRQLAEAVLALQTTTAPRFGDLDDADAHGPGDLPEALRRRADRLIADEAQRARFVALLDREADRLGGDGPTISHDDLHSGNVVLSTAADGRWRLAALLDWDKAWAGPAESDVARMALWDDMTGPGFWEVYRAAVPEREGWPRRAALHQLLWCLEYAAPTARHRADTAALWAALGGT
jgi:hypothetical protein